MTKTNSRLVIYSLIIFILSSAIYYFFNNILYSIGLIVVGDLIFFNLIVFSKKLSIILSKIFRPILFYGLMQSYLMVFGQTSMSVFILCNLIFITLHSLIIYHEIQPDSLNLPESVVTLILIFLVNNFAAIGLSQANIPIEVTVVASIAANFLLVGYWAKRFTKKPEIIAGIWGLICAEIILIMSNWIVLYQPIPRIYISQIGIITLSLAYSLGGITVYQKNHKLNRNIAIEYMSVSLLVFIIMIILTRWTVAS